MIKWLILSFLLASSLPAFSDQEAAEFRFPREAELERILGFALDRGVPRVTWEAGEPPQTNIWIYHLEPPRYEEKRLTRLAETLGVEGTPETMPIWMDIAPGYWIKEPDSENPRSYEAVGFSEHSGFLIYASGKNTHRWDIENHRPLAVGVPTPEQAFSRTLDLLPSLGVATNDLEHTTNGVVRWKSYNDVTWYNARGGNRPRTNYVRRVNVGLYQKVPKGGRVLPVGGGGTLRTGFMSEGELSYIRLMFRPMKPMLQFPSLSKDELIKKLKAGDGRSFSELIPDSFTVTDCFLVYPMGNSSFRQDYAWPFYCLHGYIGESDASEHIANFYISAFW